MHRGGNGIEKVYRLLEPGMISIQDDRHLTQPWGIFGGKPGACSEKFIERRDGTREPLPAKVDNVQVRRGDRIIFRTAGGGGWGDPLDRDAIRVRSDVARGQITAEKARSDYGVVVSGIKYELDVPGTKDLRDAMKRTRKPLELFEYGDRPLTVG